MTKECKSGPDQKNSGSSTFVNCSLIRSPGTTPSTKVGKRWPSTSTMHRPWRWCASPTQSADTVSPFPRRPSKFFSCTFLPSAGVICECRRLHCPENNLNEARISSRWAAERSQRHEPLRNFGIRKPSNSADLKNTFLTGNVSRCQANSKELQDQKWRTNSRSKLHPSRTSPRRVLPRTIKRKTWRER
jgi:hypothetical protein